MFIFVFRRPFCFSVAILVFGSHFVFFSCHFGQDIFDQLDGTDIVTMSETWLHPEYDNDLINWEGMKLYRQDQAKKKGGGYSGVY